MEKEWENSAGSRGGLRAERLFHRVGSGFVRGDAAQSGQQQGTGKEEHSRQLYACRNPEDAADAQRVDEKTACQIGQHAHNVVAAGADGLGRGGQAAGHQGIDVGYGAGEHDAAGKPANHLPQHDAGSTAGIDVEKLLDHKGRAGNHQRTAVSQPAHQQGGEEEQWDFQKGAHKIEHARKGGIAAHFLHQLRHVVLPEIHGAAHQHVDYQKSHIIVILEKTPRLQLFHGEGAGMGRSPGLLLVLAGEGDAEGDQSQCGAAIHGDGVGGTGAVEAEIVGEAGEGIAERSPCPHRAVTHAAAQGSGAVDFAHGPGLADGDGRIAQAVVQRRDQQRQQELFAHHRYAQCRQPQHGQAEEQRFALGAQLIRKQPQQGRKDRGHGRIGRHDDADAAVAVTQLHIVGDEKNGRGKHGAVAAEQQGIVKIAVAAQVCQQSAAGGSGKVPSHKNSFIAIKNYIHSLIKKERNILLHAKAERGSCREKPAPMVSKISHRVHAIYPTNRLSYLLYWLKYTLSQVFFTKKARFLRALQVSWRAGRYSAACSLRRIS